MQKIALIFILFWAASFLKAETKIKDQKKSLINFEKVDQKDFLSFHLWKNDQDEKALFPEWETIVREREYKEMVGIFLQCVGECRVNKEINFFRPQFRSRLYEGDDLETGPDSYAWVFLFDGTMIRLSPDSSLTINEFNLGVSENFISARVNYGNVLWLSRKNFEYESAFGIETDQLFFPLALYDANPSIDMKAYVESALDQLLRPSEALKNQVVRLNELIKANNGWVKNKATYVLLILPNISLFGYSPSIDVVRLLGGKSYVKQRTKSDLLYGGEEEELSYQLRGYDNAENHILEKGKWWEVDEKGKAIEEDRDPKLKFLGELVTKRIYSLLVERELLMQKYSRIFYLDKYDSKRLALEEGYRLWGNLKEVGPRQEDLFLRVQFLKEYHRRIETSHLNVEERLTVKLKERGERMQKMEYTDKYFKRALDKLQNTSSSDSFYIPENGEILNSTQKWPWKEMHGIK